MKNFKKIKLNEARKKRARKKHPRDMTTTELDTLARQEERRVEDLGGPKKRRRSGRIRSTDPGEPDSDLPGREDSSTEYHRLGYVLAEALRVEDEEPKSSNAYVRKLAESRYGREQNKFRHNPTTAQSRDASVKATENRKKKYDERQRREELAGHEASPSQEKALKSVFAAQPHKKK